MDFEYSPRTRELMRRVDDFMQAHVFPAEAEYEEFVQDPAKPPGVLVLKLRTMRFPLVLGLGSATAKVLALLTMP